MKVKEDYIVKEVAGSYVVVPTGAASLDFNSIITMNETGAFLWKQLEEDKNEQQLLLNLLEEYDINETTAMADIDQFIAKLKDADLVE